MLNVWLAGLVDDGQDHLIHSADHGQFPRADRRSGEAAEGFYLSEADGVGCEAGLPAVVQFNEPIPDVDAEDGFFGRGIILAPWREKRSRKGD
ncbi:hypothetical protein N182_18610 [Sinorhizobium sp. GL2]|nr:hypothetical protein N182_18610 [Sinorhizobium sp. GL2]